MTWQTHTLPINGIHLHVTSTGGDKAPLVALHGRTGNGLLWTRTARLLAPYFDVLMPDLRAHGLSDAPDEGYDHATMAHDILGLMDVLGITNAVLVGGSMGAALATRIAAHHPNRVEKLVLHLNTWTSRAQLEPGYLEKKIQRKRRQYRTWSNMSLPDLIKQVRVLSPDWAEEDVVLAAQTWQQVRENAAQTFAHDLSKAEWRALAQQVRCPMLVFVGRAEAGYNATHNFCTTELPNCTFASLKGGHTAMYEDFETFTDHLTKFLDLK